MVPPPMNGHTVGEDLKAERELLEMLREDEKAVLARYLVKGDQVHTEVRSLRKDFTEWRHEFNLLGAGVDLCRKDIDDHCRAHHKATVKKDGWKAVLASNSEKIAIAIILTVNFILTGKILLA